MKGNLSKQEIYPFTFNTQQNNDENISISESDLGRVNPSNKQILQFEVEGKRIQVEAPPQNLISEGNFSNPQNSMQQANNKGEFNFLEEYDDDPQEDYYFGYQEGDAHLKFMNEQQIQADQRVIAERLGTQQQQYPKWEKNSRIKQGIQFNADFKVSQSNPQQDDNQKGKENQWKCNSMMGGLLMIPLKNQLGLNKVSFEPELEEEWNHPQFSDFNGDGLSLLDQIIVFPYKENTQINQVGGSIGNQKKSQQGEQQNGKASININKKNPQDEIKANNAELPSFASLALNQRTLCTILQSEFRLRGNSQCNIILRSQNLQNEESVLLRFSKEGYGFDMRLFVLMGRYNITDQEYLFIKKCEVPQIKISEDHSISDYIDVKCKVIDIGTDQIDIKLHLNQSVVNKFKISYKQNILPIFDDFSVFIAGTGEGVAINRAFVEQVDRNAYLNRKDRSCTNSARCVCVINQSIFI